jgi:hypothetical protein
MPQKKTFLMKFSLALLACLSVAVWFEWRLREMPNSYIKKRELLRLRQADIEILVMGASSANQGISPAFLGRPGFNLANVGQDLYYDARLLEKQLPSMPKLKLVILPMAFISLDYQFGGTPEFWRTFCYSVYWGIPNEYKASRWDIRGHSALALVEPLQALKDAREGFKGDCPEYDQDGYQAVAAPSEELAEFKINDLTARKRIAYHKTVMKTSNRPANRAELEGMLGLLAQRGLKAAMVIVPVHESYYSNLPPAELKGVRSVLEEVSASRGTRVFDFLEDSRFQLADFSDVDHLSSKGAEKFGKILKKELVDPLLGP